jgi:hypothetical protein
MADVLEEARAAMKRGDRFVAYGDHRPRSRLYIEATRVARDGTWADIRVCNCFVMWTKRVLLPLPSDTHPRQWTTADLDIQCAEWDVSESEDSVADYGSEPKDSDE